MEHEEDGNKPLEPVMTLLTECKHLVRFMKSTGKNGHLNKGLEQEVDTRWNTRLLMLQFIQNAIAQILHVHGENVVRIQNINTELLSTITQFLEPFKKASDELESDKCPTIQKVVLYQLLIKKHLQTYSNLQENIFSDGEELTKLNKARIISNIELKLLQIELEQDDRHSDFQEVNNIRAKNH